MRSYCLFNSARAPDVGAFPRPPAGGIIMSMGFSADGLLLAAGDNKGAAHVWAKQPSGYVGGPGAGRQQLCCRRQVCWWCSENRCRLRRLRCPRCRRR